ncbi:HlyD family type I secretion periplasmic adaptor subunit [Sneathiella sp.]|jgi:adhesin transport system membrane fusion protein|uniref:HlyD family type I secretion periplasmic adaptor subunit n=1 Tax=Sneathiella sp. TaxID=1964365 RepID=UPI0039E2C649
MSNYAELERKYPLSAWRWAGLLAIGMISAFVIWTQYAIFEEVAVLPGEVVPRDQVKVIQHLEGGIVEKIFVKEGQLVQEGDPLMHLDLAINAINEKALNAQLQGLLIKRARLIAESENSAPNYPKITDEVVKAVLEAEKNIHRTRLAQHKSKLKILEDKAQQKKLDVDQLQIKKKAIQADLEVARRKFSMSKELLSANLTPKIEHLELEIALTRLEGELKILGPSIPRAKAAASEFSEKVQEEKLNFIRDAQEQLSKTEIEIARLRELLVTAGEQVTRTTVRSPIDGIVKNLRINTLGGIVRPGDAIMDIVPSSDILVVEAKLNPADRAFIEVGQQVTVKLTAYDFFTYGGLSGRVSNIAADSTTTSDGETFFKVIVETETGDADKVDQLLVTPGMQAMVDVHTGSKSVMQYLLQPVLKMRHESFRER